MKGRFGLSTIIFVYLGLVAVGIGVISLVPLKLIGSYQAKLLEDKTEEAVGAVLQESQTLMEGLAAEIISGKARDVAEQLSLYLKAQRYRSIDLTDRELRRISLQKIGQSGYTCLYDCLSEKTLIHPDSAIEGTSVHDFKEKFPDWWRIMGRSLDCIEQKGFYAWPDPSGSVKRKYMHVAPVKGSTLMVAATIPLDEFSQTKAMVEKLAVQKLRESKEALSDTTSKVITQTSLISIFFFLFLLGLGTVFAYRILTYVSDIRFFANGLAADNYSIEFESNPRIEEFYFIQSDLKRMRDKIVEFQTEKNRMASLNSTWKLSRQVVHDLRAPLSGLLTLSEMISSDSNSSKSKDVIKLLQAVIGRLSEMIDSAIRPKGNYLHNIERFELTHLLRQIVEEYQDKWGVRRHQVRIEFIACATDGEVFLIGSRLNIRRVITNLVQNALEALEGEGRVLIRVVSKGHAVVIEVEDNGKGIPEEIRHQIFQEGFTFGKKNGSGLGLHFCQEVISEHGGDIDFESFENKGTKFSVILPLPQFSQGVYEQENGPVRPLLMESGKKILVIDDSVTMLSKWFKRAVDYGLEGDYFNHYEEAQERIDWSSGLGQYGVIILDYLFPNSAFDGVDIAKDFIALMRKNDEHIPIYICTSDFRNEKLVQFEKESGVAVLPKIYFEELRFTFENKVVLAYAE